ncbi:MAG: Macrolide export protein MacA [Planctomycetota bacterium]|jgi:HlyD family secretion protein
MTSSKRALLTIRPFLMGLAIIGVLTGLTLLVRSVVIKKWMTPELPPELASVEPVRRVRFDSFVNAPGEIRSANNTVVECEIENLTVRVQGRSIEAGRSTRILTIVPDGSKVKKDDVLCTLDSREFEEMVRLQLINVERAKADLLQAEMELKVAEIAMDEYRDGTAKQQIQTLNGRIALAQTDSTRLTGRLDWARKMLEKGYLSKASVRLEELALQRSDMQLTDAMTQLNTYEKYSMPKQMHQLQTRITSYKTNHLLETKRFERYQERLENYRKQVEKCVIRAPHDGMAVYANEDDGDTRIEEGAEVRQGQDLFYLPDLENMQVMAKLSESIVKKVEPGMKVRVLIESTDQVECDGIVDRIAQFPIQSTSWRASNEVKNYYCVVKIQSATPEIRPGLNSEIRILTGEPKESLTISPNVVCVEGDSEFCFVMTTDGLVEKREIQTVSGDPYTLEVLAGLQEGELVLTEPTKIQESPELIARTVVLNSNIRSSQEIASLDHSLSEFVAEQPGVSDPVVEQQPAELPVGAALGVIQNGY